MAARLPSNFVLNWSSHFNGLDASLGTWKHMVSPELLITIPRELTSMAVIGALWPFRVYNLIKRNCLTSNLMNLESRTWMRSQFTTKNRSSKSITANRTS